MALFPPQAATISRAGDDVCSSVSWSASVSMRLTIASCGLVYWRIYCAVFILYIVVSRARARDITKSFAAQLVSFHHSASQLRDVLLDVEGVVRSTPLRIHRHPKRTTEVPARGWNSAAGPVVLGVTISPV